MELEPQGDLIAAMVLACETMSDERLIAMARAQEARGIASISAAWDAAHAISAERAQSASTASWNMRVAVAARLLFSDLDAEVGRLCGWAVGDAGMAVSTQDLVGKGRYTHLEYENLMYPWREGETECP